MNTLKNTIHLIGRLGQDPEVRTAETGKKVARLSLATSDNFTDKENKQARSTQWHTLIVWGNLATVCEKYLKKGREIAVEGRLIYNNWEDRNGIKHHSTEIQVNELSFIGNQHEFMSTVAAISSK